MPSFHMDCTARPSPCATLVVGVSLCNMCLTWDSGATGFHLTDTPQLGAKRFQLRGELEAARDATSLPRSVELIRTGISSCLTWRRGTGLLQRQQPYAVWEIDTQSPCCLGNRHAIPLLSGSSTRHPLAVGVIDTPALDASSVRQDTIDHLR